MSTLAPGGRITNEIQKEEIQVLKNNWKTGWEEPDILHEIFDQNELDKIDLFDRIQLKEIIKVCRRFNSISKAGRHLFSVSRLKKKKSNDADRLKKYLEKFNLTWNKISDNQK